MSDTVTLSITAAQQLATDALTASRTHPRNAEHTARALVAAEADGQAGHGLSRVPSYAAQARSGKVDGFATPAIEQVGPAAVRVDAKHGFAYPAIVVAIDALATLAAASGIAAAAIHRSHHFGQAGAHAERLAGRGLIGLVFSNTPKAMSLWGGREPLLGTNPIGFAAPLPGEQAPLVIDLALSVAARARIVAAQKAGRPIPAGWAVDAQGQPTTDPTAALSGSLLPIGEAKGAALALMIEILAAALTGSAFGWQASSFFEAQGSAPGVGHLLLAMDPTRLSGNGYFERMQLLLEAVAAEEGVRLPGTRRLHNRERAQHHGVSISGALEGEIRALIAAPVPP